jgi:hypothetical protein
MLLTVYHQLLQSIKMLTGVVEVGLFCNMAEAAYFGNEVSTAIWADHYNMLMGLSAFFRMVQYRLEIRMDQ